MKQPLPLPYSFNILNRVISAAITALYMIISVHQLVGQSAMCFKKLIYKLCTTLDLDPMVIKKHVLEVSKSVLLAC